MQSERRPWAQHRALLIKWWKTIESSWSKYLTYKFSFAIMFIAPSLVFLLIKYNLWSAIFHSAGEGAIIKGYSLEKMLEYQLLVFTVGLVGTSYTSLNIAMDIRHGRISNYLIYPFDLWQFHTASFFSFFGLQTLVATFTLIVILSTGLIHPLEISHLLNGFAITLLVGLFWFGTQFTLGILAFWMEETWILRVMFSSVASFLSGSFFPLEIFPPWLGKIIAYTPFPYITYVPVKVVMGEYTGNLLVAMANLSLWILGIAFLGSYLWKKGIGRYTGAGM